MPVKHAKHRASAYQRLRLASILRMQIGEEISALEEAARNNRNLLACSDQQAQRVKDRLPMASVIKQHGEWLIEIPLWEIPLWEESNRRYEYATTIISMLYALGLKISGSFVDELSRSWRGCLKPLAWEEKSHG